MSGDADFPSPTPEELRKLFPEGHPFSLTAFELQCDEAIRVLGGANAALVLDYRRRREEIVLDKIDDELGPWRPVES